MSNKLEVPQSVFALMMVLIMLASGFLMLYDYLTGNLLTAVSKNIFIGILVGIMLALGGYLKSIKIENGEVKIEDFDPVKFLLTTIIGVGAGIFMWKFGMNFFQAQGFWSEFLITTGLLAPVEVWLKVFVRSISISVRA